MNVIAGRAWIFGDNINTDLMLPNSVNGGANTLDEQARAVFGANRPGWVDEMRPGDFIVGGLSYGIGSNPPAARPPRPPRGPRPIPGTIHSPVFRYPGNF